MTPAVVCFGEALWDLTPAGRFPGGAPLNVALRLASFGVETILLSRVGDDQLGCELIETLQAGGLDAAHLQIDPRQPTGVVKVDASNPHSPRYDICAPAAWDYIDADSFVQASGMQAGPVVFGSLGVRNAVSRASLFGLLERSPLRIFDVNLRPPFESRELIEELLERTDCLKLNENELRRVAGWLGATGSPQQLIASICDRYGIDAACVTFGADGAVMCRNGRFFSHRSFTVPVVDTVGCGDAFLAGWLTKLLAEAPPQETLAHACAAGALAATAAGANAPISAKRIDMLARGG